MERDKREKLVRTGIFLVLQCEFFLMFDNRRIRINSKVVKLILARGPHKT